MGPRALFAAVRHPLGPLVIYSGALALLGLIAAQDPWSNRFITLWELVGMRVSGILILLWMQGDARKRQRIPCFDFTMIAMVFFPISLIWYCLSTRGWKGLLLVLALLLLWGLPSIAYDLARG